MNEGILLHKVEDDVGVAAMDLRAGEEVQAVTLEGDPVAVMSAGVLLRAASTIPTIRNHEEI